jgi:hypothetical protein
MISPTGVNKAMSSPLQIPRNGVLENWLFSAGPFDAEGPPQSPTENWKFR